MNSQMKKIARGNYRYGNVWINYNIHNEKTFIHECVFDIDPFPPSVPIWQRLAKLSILILEGTIKKISYERRDYESVDEKS